MLFDIKNDVIKEYLKQAEFGIEREGLRICSDGRLAQSPHPFESNKNIDRDFCENQIELISDVFTAPEKVNAHLLSLQKIVNSRLTENDEYLWPFSNPPEIRGEEEIPVAKYSGSLKNKSVYRQYLARKYGKIKMLFSGIHLNFSFTNELVRTAFEQSGYESFSDYKNDLYLHFAARLTQYTWLVVYLTAASPVADASVGTGSNVYSSVRCSDIGYWNHFTPILDYSSLDSYIASIQKYIDDGNLRSVSELYYPVRVKPRGANSLEALAENGINHLELRVIDVNPLSRTGIFAEDIHFVHLLILYLASLPENDFNGKDQIKAIQNVKSAAVFGSEDIRQNAISVLGDIRLFTEKYFPVYSNIIDYQLKKTERGQSYAEKVSSLFGDDYMNKGLALAKEYREVVGYV